MFFLTKPKSAPAVRRGILQIGAREIEVVVRFSPLAKRMSVKVHPMRAEVSVVAPSRRAFDAAMAFAQSEGAWIVRQLDKIPERLRLDDGQIVPLRARPYRIVHAPEQRLTTVDDVQGRILVGGRAEHVPRRAADFLKRLARGDFETVVADYAARLEVRPRHISLRDTTGRWGSCSASRGLSFSWRLIFAPPDVLAYVAAHEVAHLREMNHGPKFWALVHEVYGDPKPPQRWLSANGADLHRYDG